MKEWWEKKEQCNIALFKVILRLNDSSSKCNSSRKRLILLELSNSYRNDVYSNKKKKSLGYVCASF